MLRTFADHLKQEFNGYNAASLTKDLMAVIRPEAASAPLLTPNASASGSATAATVRLFTQKTPSQHITDILIYYKDKIKGPTCMSNRRGMNKKVYILYMMENFSNKDD